MASPRIIIPHGLAADVLRVLQCRRWLVTHQIAEVVGTRSGVGYSGVWAALHDLWSAGFVEVGQSWLGGEEWRLLWTVTHVPVRDEPGEWSGEVGRD